MGKRTPADGPPRLRFNKNLVTLLTLGSNVGIIRVFYGLLTYLYQKGKFHYFEIPGAYLKVSASLGVTACIAIIVTYVTVMEFFWVKMIGAIRMAGIRVSAAGLLRAAYFLQGLRKGHGAIVRQGAAGGLRPGFGKSLRNVKNYWGKMKPYMLAVCFPVALFISFKILNSLNYTFFYVGGIAKILDGRVCFVITVLEFVLLHCLNKTVRHIFFGEANAPFPIYLLLISFFFVITMNLCYVYGYYQAHTMLYYSFILADDPASNGLPEGPDGDTKYAVLYADDMNFYTAECHTDASDPKHLIIDRGKYRPFPCDTSGLEFGHYDRVSFQDLHTADMHADPAYYLNDEFEGYSGGAEQEGNAPISAKDVYLYNKVSFIPGISEYIYRILEGEG